MLVALMAVPFASQSQALLSEGFGTSIPTGWSMYTGLASNVFNGTALTSATYGWSFGSNNGLTDPHARVNIYGTSCNKWLVTPSIALTGVSNPQLSFDMAFTAYSGANAAATSNIADDKFMVIVSTDDGATWSVANATKWMITDSVTAGVADYDLTTLPYTDYQTFTIDLTSYVGSTIKIAFYGESTVSGGDNNLHIDNVYVGAPITCFKVTDLAIDATQTTTSSLTLTWTDAQNTGATYTIYNMADSSVVASGVSGTSYTVTGLNANTAYTFAVMTDCGGGDVTELTAPVTGRTACDAYTTLPYVEEFNGYTGFPSYPYYGPSVMPACWIYYSNGTNTAETSGSTAYYGGVAQYNGTSYGSMVANNPYLYLPIQLTGSAVTSATYLGYAEARGDVRYAVMPAFQEALNSLQISFDYKMSSAYSATAAAAVLELGYVTGDDVTTFVSMQSWNAVTTTQNIVDLNLSVLAAQAPQGARLAFKFSGVHNGTGTSSYSNVGCGIDNIVVESLPSCSRISNLAVAGTTSSSITLTWADAFNTGATYTVSDSAGVIATGINGTTYTVTGLDANTEYTFSVVANCSANDASEATTVSGRTACAPMALPWTTGFEADDLMTTSNSEATPALPWCTQRYVSVAATSGRIYPYAYNSTTYAHDGSSRSLYFYGSTTTTYPDTMAFILPEVDVTTYPMNNNRISFWARSSSTSYNKTVYVCTMSDPTDLNTLTLVDSVVVSGTTYAQYTVNLNAATATDAHVVLAVMRGSGNLYIDDLTFEEMPSCVEISDLSVSAATTTSITLAWTDAINTGATYSVYTVTPTGSELVASGISGTTYTVTGLTANTAYTFSVEANCSANDASAAVTVSARTSCETIATLPYTVDFEDCTANEMPSCWSKPADGATINVQSSTTNAHGGSMYLRFFSGSDRYAVMPSITVPEGGLQVTFWTRPESATNASCASLQVGYATSATDMSTFVPMATYQYNDWSSAVHEQKNVVMANIPAGAYIVFYHTGTSNWYWYLDDITVDAAPSCAPVTALTADNVTADGATLSWTGDAASYNVYNMTDATAAVLVGTATTNTYTLTGLTATTNYTFGVAAVCDNAESDIVSTSFTTACAAVSLPFTETFETTSASRDCWSTDGPGTWQFGSYSSTGATYEGSAYAYIRHTSNGNVTKLVSPVIAGGENGVQLQFAHIQKTWGGDQDEMRVYYRTSAAADWTMVAEYTADIQNWTVETVIIPNAVYQVAFEMTDGYGYGVGVDSVVFNLPPSCLPVSELAVDGVTATSVTLTWTATNPAATYTIYNGDTQIATAVSGTTYTVTGLTASTGYTFGVVANCSATDASDMATVSAMTDCEGGSCTITIVGTDNYNDSWNGASIAISQNGATVGTYTVPDEESPYTATFSVCSGIPVSFSWNLGSYDDECDFVIYNATGDSIFSGNGDDMTGTFFTLNNACASDTTGDTTVVTEGLTLNVSVNDSTMGSIVPAPGTYTFAQGETISFTATANDGYHFESWSADYSAYGMGLIAIDTNTTYTHIVTADEVGIEMDVIAVFAADSTAATEYCTPSPTSVDGNGITSVSFGGMTNTTHNATSGNAMYEDYTTMAGSVPAGTTATVEITYATGYTYGTIIWVDWNNNMAFDANEVVYRGTSESSNPTTLTATFDIPATQALGNYRMRIVGADSYFDSYVGSTTSTPDPCASYSWGVAEDYTLTVTEAPSCLAVSGLTVTDVTPTTATITWNDNGAASYGIYDLAQGDTVLFTTVTDTTYTFTILQPNSYYTIGIVANCSANDTSDYAVVTVTTPCEAVMLPYTESFEATSNTRNCWNFVSNNTSNVGGNNGMMYVLLGTNAMWRFSSYSYASDYNQYGYSPMLDASALTDADMIHVDVRYATYGSSDNLYFGYINGNDTVWDATAYTTSGQTDFRHYVANIPLTATQLAVHYYGSYSYYAWIDSVVVSGYTIPACPAPANVTFADATSTQIAISWDGDSNATYGIINMADSSLYGTIGGNYAVINGLTPTTQYTFGIYTVCDDGNSDTVTVTASTACGTVAIPFVEDWEETSSTLTCWTVANIASSTGIAATAYSGSRSFRFAYNTNPPQYLFSPELTGTENGVQVMFHYKIQSTSYPESFQLGYSTTTNDTAAFTWSAEQTGLTNTDWLAYNEIFTTSNIKFIAIRYTANDMYYLYIDSVVIREAPSCMPVTALTVDSTSATSVTLSWADADNSGATYTVYNGTTAVATGITTTNYTVTGLTASTGYTFGVVANCTADAAADMVTVSVVTDCAGESCNITISGSDVYGDGWDGAFITISQNGTAMGTFTVTADSNTLTFPVCSGSPVAFSWTASTSSYSYPDEISFTIADGASTTVHSLSDATDMANGVFFTLNEPCPSCLPAADLTVDTAETTSVTISWSGNAASYNVYNGTTFVANVTTTSYTFTGLTAGTAYTFGVEALCGADDTAFMVTVNAVTEFDCSDITTLPYNENFESGALGCWTTVNSSSDTAAQPWMAFNVNQMSSATAHSGSYVASSWSWNGSAMNANAWLISPKFVLPTVAAGDTLMLSWWEATAANWPDSYSVELSTTTNDTAAFTTNIRPYTVATGDWVLRTVDMTAYAGQSVYVAFHHVDYDANYLFIDDISMTVGAAPVPAPDTLTMIFTVNDATMGTTVPAPGTYQYLTGDTVRFQSVPNTGYHHYGWVITVDGEADTLEGYQNAYVPANAWMSYGTVTMTAIFEAGNPDSTTVTYAVNDATMGTINPNGTQYVYVGSAVEATATAFAGYELDAWVLGIYSSTGNTLSLDTLYSDDPDFANPMNFGSVPQSFADNGYTLSVTAIFAVAQDDQYMTVTLSVNDATMGTTNPVPGTYQYGLGDVATFTAIANPGYHFVSWNMEMDVYGTTYLVPVSDEATLTDTVAAEDLGFAFALIATFESDSVVGPIEDSLVLNIAVNDITMGTTNPVPGTYIYGIGDTINATAIPNDGYHVENVIATVNYMGFEYSDTLEVPTLTISYPVDSDMVGMVLTVTVIFAPDSAPQPVYYTVTVSSGDAEMGSVSPEGSTQVLAGESFTVIATPAEGYQFVAWMMGNAALSINAEYTFTVYQDMNLVARFDTIGAELPTYYTVTGLSNDENMGIVLGSGMYEAGEIATLTARPNAGYRFVRWSTGETTESINITVTEDVTVTAYFEPNTGIEDADMDDVTIYSTDSKIVVRGAEGRNVYVFDINGRMMNSQMNAAEAVEFRMANTGVYLVKVGEAPAKRVLVVR